MNGRTSAQLFCAILLYIESMACRVECIRSDTELPWGRKKRRFGFLVTKDVLQLLHNFIFELRALIGVECLGSSKDTKYPFDKSFRNGLLFLARKRDERRKSSEMINDS